MLVVDIETECSTLTSWSRNSHGFMNKNNYAMKTYYQIETNAQYNSVIMKVLNSISLFCAH